ncbi:MAG TPA: class I SAM-dependent methyltransferase [Thermohalobaculum sp.]|nr:class I SAM-dependent methyltransferase [Thermohalobaculum sp.]
MSGFTADWLALRADADRRARNARVAARLAQAVAGQGGVAVVDLGSGTGANLAATAPHLPRPQRWRLVDHDGDLLAEARAPEGVTVEPVVADLGAGVAPLLHPGPQLVTASAFFDLVGAAWLDAFVGAAAAAGTVVHAVLTYDGRQDWAGAHPLDGAVLAAFNAHQRQDKGLGPALGPLAHSALADRLRAAGFGVTEGASDWRLEAPRDAALIAALAEGTGAALASLLGAGARDWAAARARAGAVTIGHRDLVALPPGAAAPQ